MKEFESYFLDTNIFLRPIIKDHPQQTADCEKLFVLIEENKIAAATSNIVLAEFLWTAQSFYKISKPETIASMKGIVSISGLAIEDSFDSFAALQYYESFSVKFIDALIASHKLIQEGKAIVISYDKDFDKLGIKRKEPKDIIWRA